MPQVNIPIAEGQLFITSNGPARLIQVGTNTSVLKLIANGEKIVVQTTDLPMIRADQKITFLRDLIGERVLSNLPDGATIALRITNPDGSEIIHFELKVGEDMTMYDGN